MKLSFQPQWTHSPAAFRHTWEGVLNVDQFRWFVRRDLQDQLELARDELKAKHIRAVGMYDDELRVFRPSPGSFMGFGSKEPRTNWQIVDYAVDSLVDRGLHPMFTTSFVPSAMASGPVTVFTTQGHTSPPKDWRQWEDFVGESVRHAVDRYTLDVVREWYFEVWNEPNVLGWFWGGTQQDFLRLWETTYRAIKGVDATLRVGGPSTAKAEWIAELVEHGRAHDCTPDYLVAHIYNNDSPIGAPLVPINPTLTYTDSSPSFSLGVMRDVRALADRLGYKGELHWNEWGRSFHGIDPRREDPNEAAFIVRQMDHAGQTADAFAYWCISDIYDQVGYGREAFHGGYGLLNLQGLRKPAYHAFQLLSRLGHQRVPVRFAAVEHDLHGAIATVGAERDHVLVYAYQHVDAPDRQAIEVSIDLPAHADGVSLHRLSSRENNVIAEWRELGAPAYLSRAQTRELASRNALRAADAGAVRVSGAEGRATATFTLESPGVALLEIRRKA